MAKCGAKTKQGDRGPCKRNAMPNGRCKIHGGATPSTNQNAVKHGFYSKCYTPEEQRDLPDIKIGTLEAELQLAKTQLRRAASIPEFEKDGVTPNDKYRPDVIERLLNVVGRLEKQHSEITTDNPGEDFNPDDEFM